MSLDLRTKRAIKSTIMNEVYEALGSRFAIQHEGRFKVIIIVGSAERPTYFEVTVKEKKNAHSVHHKNSD